METQITHSEEIPQKMRGLVCNVLKRVCVPEGTSLDTKAVLQSLHTAVDGFQSPEFTNFRESYGKAAASMPRVLPERVSVEKNIYFDTFVSMCSYADEMRKHSVLLECGKIDKNKVAIDLGCLATCLETIAKCHIPDIDKAYRN